MFKCSKCNKTFNINDFFNEYQKVKNEENKTSNKTYCPCCGAVNDKKEK